MDSVLEKLSSYNFFTNLFPGVIFCYLADALYGFDLIQEDLLVGVFVYYFVGMVISRIGSLFIEEVIERVGIVEYPDYTDFLAAEKADPKLQVMLEVNNAYRSVISLLTCLFVSGVWGWLLSNFAWLEPFSDWLVLIGLLAVFLLAYQKQTQYIVKRVNGRISAPKGESKVRDA